ncbi:MAG TPA: RnfH family protein [Rhodocyclaceae bacterium]|nr:MAG: RnfH family protein [Betaproteobacteria bacterium CG2_30_68_42]PIV73660.1 MAG: RnfH family protein [Rhodocyclales bacterium CG17_big_fil_post_rev_8_21_14_2_50_68_7]PIX74945.1 MAG: RnfH family protein [Rhodocyclales bacterium CG_4_10_14_3_um_filter_68_10]PJA57648.1 MAG: RnfH family protein [Rhodocyclales bacterium CG_4_9_14_3_um_filter_68_10]HCX33426.1 RnfH family protein [Rhodocyclaceae bacterium]
MTESISVEVVYALPEKQEIVRLSVMAGSTAGQAIVASGLLDRYPEIDLDRNRIGIYGKLAAADAVLADHDRVEIYRPLIADPKQARRKRAEQGKPPRKPVRGAQ